MVLPGRCTGLLSRARILVENSASRPRPAATLAASFNYPLRRGPSRPPLSQRGGRTLWQTTFGLGAVSRRRADHRRRATARARRSCRIAATRFAMMSQIWLLDPGPLRRASRAVKQGLRPLEPATQPVMLQLRIRACHVTGHFKSPATTSAPKFTSRRLSKPQRDVRAASCCRRPASPRAGKVLRTLAPAVSFIEARAAQRVLLRRPPATSAHRGRAGSYNTMCAQPLAPRLGRRVRATPGARSTH